MDAALSLAGLVEEFNALVEAQDFEGAEELLAQAISQHSKHEPYLHFQMGRMYLQWNKLSSAINHLSKAAEMAKQNSDEFFVLQVVEELKLAKKRQVGQRP